LRWSARSRPRVLGKTGPSALPVRGPAKQTAAKLVDLVDVVGRDMEIGLVEYHVVVGVVRVLHCAENGVGTAVEHYVERAKVNVRS